MSGFNKQESIEMVEFTPRAQQTHETIVRGEATVIDIELEGDDGRDSSSTYVGIEIPEEESDDETSALLSSAAATESSVDVVIDIEVIDETSPLIAAGGQDEENSSSNYVGIEIPEEESDDETSALLSSVAATESSVDVVTDIEVIDETSPLIAAGGQDEESSSSTYVGIEIPEEESDDETSALLSSVAATESSVDVVIDIEVIDETSPLIAAGGQDEETGEVAADVVIGMDEQDDEILSSIARLFSNPDGQDEEGAEGDNEAEKDGPVCRICLTSDTVHGPFVRPCGCMNNSVPIAEHHKCLVEWVLSRTPPQYSCMTCHIPYKYKKTGGGIDFLACLLQNANTIGFQFVAAVAAFMLMLYFILPGLIPAIVVLLPCGFVVESIGFYCYEACENPEYQIPSELIIFDQNAEEENGGA